MTDINHVLTFGKYKGESLADVFEYDAQYVVWLHHNTLFELSADLLETAEDSINKYDTFSRREVEQAVGRISDREE